MRRTVLIAVAGLVLATGACDPAFETPLPSVVGARVVDGQLELFTGTPCADVTEVEVRLDPGAREVLATVVMTAMQPTELDRFRIDEAPTGFRATAPLPAGVSWSDADGADLRVTTTDGDRSASVDLAELREQDEHPGDYLVGTRWLSEDEVLDGDGGDYALLCSPVGSG